MSTVHTAIAPSFGGGGGGCGGGKRGRDGDDGRDRRRPDKPKPLDKISLADFGPDGRNVLKGPQFFGCGAISQLFLIGAPAQSPYDPGHDY